MTHLVFTASNLWISRAIRWLTRGTVSHVMIQFAQPTWGGDFVVQATFPNVQLVPVELGKKNVAYEYVCVFQPDAGFVAIRRLIGEWYDFRGLLTLGLVRVWWRLFRRKLKFPFRTTSSQFCSELVTRFLQGSLIPGTENLKPEKVTPEQLRRFCEDHPHLFQKIQR